MTRIVSVSTALYDGYPLEQAIDEIAAAGARSIEPAYIKGYVVFDESAFSRGNGALLSSRIADAGMVVTAVSAHMDLGEADAAAMLRRRIGFAATLGARFLITNAGAAADRARIVALLETVARDCRAAGIQIALENPGHGFGNLIGGLNDGTALLSALQLPEVGLNYDVGNVFTYSRETVAPEIDLRGAGRGLLQVHLKDVASSGGGWAFTALGDGSIDYRAVWAELPRDLPVGIELPLRLDRSGRADPSRRAERVPLDAIRQAMRRSLDFVAALDRE
jgi:sugar phosphate isomerase/epimerase